LSSFVVDASVAAKWFFNEQLADEARIVLDQSESLYAPDFMLMEVDEFFCKRVRRGDLRLEDAQDARIMLRNLPVNYFPQYLVADSAFEIANMTRRSLYDCIYLSLAVILDEKMITADRKFFDGITETEFADQICWIEDTAL